MKIQVVTESYWPNADGGALFERRLAYGLARDDNHVTIWAPAPRFESYDEIDGPTTIHRQAGVTLLVNRKYKISLFPFIKAGIVIRRDRPTIIHIHNAYWMGLFSLMWAKYYHLPVIMTNHFMPENLLLNLKLPSLLNRPVERLTWSYLAWFHNRADYVVSPTPTAVKLLVDHGLRSPTIAISNGVDTDEFNPNGNPTQVMQHYNIAVSKTKLLYVGRLDGEKRIDLIIAAMPELLAESSVQLIIAGFGNAKSQLEAQVKRLGIDEHVIFTGYIDELDKPLIYNAADIFVIASPAELQSIVTLEAMASGLPIVAVDVAALSELCHDGINGNLFSPDSSSSLAAAIRPLLKDLALRKRYGVESQKIIDAHHSTKAMIEAYEIAYKRAIARHGARSKHKVEAS